MPNGSDADIRSRHRGLQRRASAVVHKHSFPMHETAAIHHPPLGDVTYQRDDIHYVVPDIRALFADLLALLAEATAPAREATREAMRAARAEILRLSGEASEAAETRVLAQVDAILAEVAAYRFPERSRGGTEGWRADVAAKLARAEAHAEHRHEDQFWYGFASGLSEALSVHAARAAACRGIHVAASPTHAAHWRRRREAGEPVVSSWIDAGEGADPAEAARCGLAEAAACGVLIAHAEPGEALDPLLPEIGAALAARRRVILVAPEIPFDHPLVERAPDLDEALARARAALGLDAEVLDDSPPAWLRRLDPRAAP